MQVIVQLKVFKQLPANLASLLEALNDAVYLKFTYFVGRKIIRDHFAADQIEFQQVQKEYMTRWGVEDTSWFWSLGIFAVFLFVLVLLLMLYLLLKLWQYVSKRGSVGKAVAEYFEKKLFFSAICRYIIESYLKIVYNTLIFLAFNAGVSSKYQRIQAIGLSIIFGLLLLWPLLIVFFLTSNRNRLDDESFKRRFESLYLGNKTNNYH